MSAGSATDPPPAEATQAPGIPAGPAGPDAPAPPAHGKGQRRRWIRRWVKPLILPVAACGAGLGAVILFPTEGPVTTPSGITGLAIDGTFVPDGVSVQLGNLHHPTRTRIFVSVNSRVPERTRVTLRLDVPVNTWGGPDRCDPTGGTCLISEGTKVLTRYLNPWTPYRVGTTIWYRESGSLALPRSFANVARNAEYVSATLPVVSYYYYAPPRRHSRGPTQLSARSVPTWISLQIPHAAKYSWTSGGTIPSVAGSNATWYWSNPPGSAQLVSGVSLPVENSNGIHLFIAGALLGIAGAALVGCVQQALGG